MFLAGAALSGRVVGITSTEDGNPSVMAAWRVGDSCLPDGIFHGALDYRFVEVMPTPDAVSRSM